MGKFSQLQRALLIQCHRGNFNAPSSSGGADQPCDNKTTFHLEPLGRFLPGALPNLGKQPTARNDHSKFLPILYTRYSDRPHAKLKRRVQEPDTVLWDTCGPLSKGHQLGKWQTRKQARTAVTQTHTNHTNPSAFRSLTDSPTLPTQIRAPRDAESDDTQPRHMQRSSNCTVAHYTSYRRVAALQQPASQPYPAHLLIRSPAPPV